MNFETIASIVAVFIGLCALGVSIWQGLETRKNYHLSVTPYIGICGNWIIDSEVPGISLENKGIGPAIINDIEICYSDKKYSYLSEYRELIKDLLKDLKPVGITDLGLHLCDFGEYLEAGEKLPLIYLNKSDGDKVISLYQVLSGMTIIVSYASVYGHSFFAHYSCFY